MEIRRHHGIRLLITVAAASIALPACTRSQPGDIQQESAANELEWEAPVDADCDYSEAVVFDFTLTDQAGKEVGLGPLEGHITVVNVTASWLSPAVAGVMTLHELRAKLPLPELNIAAIFLDDDVDATRRFVDRNRVAYPVFVAADVEHLRVALEPWLLGLPTTLVIGSDANLCTAITGRVHIRQLEYAIAASRAGSS